MNRTKKMAWEASDGSFLESVEAIQATTEIHESSYEQTERVAATGLVSVEERTTTFTFNVLEAPILSLALNLVGFFSKTLGEGAKELALRIMEAHEVVPGEDPEFEDRLARARAQVYREDTINALTALGLSPEDAAAEADSLAEAGLSPDDVLSSNGAEKSNLPHH